MDNIGFVQVDPRDTVATAVAPLAAGTALRAGGGDITLGEDIPFGHKFALAPHRAGDTVVRYGQPIGVARADIAPGDWVHSHNLGTGLAGIVEYTYSPVGRRDAPRIPAGAGRTFLGYPRADGAVGIRNELWILPTVSCVNATAQAMAEEARRRFGHLCDGIYALPHNAGCSQLGEDMATTQRLLAGMARHPNAGGVLVLSLGCENNNLDYFRPVLGQVDETRVKFLVAQEAEDELEAGLAVSGEIAAAMAGDQRVETPAGKLVIGFKCGGSDALSGITANPLCGRIADRVTEMGGIGILTEVPEMFGAEQNLMNRCDSPQTFGRVVELVNRFKQYYLDHDQPIYENPAPGNKEGGITTLEEKSLGCIQKGGFATVTATLDYGQRAQTPGLNLLNGPGNDSVSITNLLAAGAQLILFTTGRGNPLGTAVPCVKLSSNSGLFRRKGRWIDFDAGRQLEGVGAEALCDQLWEQILDVASGRRRTRNEENGQREIMIFKDGVML